MQPIEIADCGPLSSKRAKNMSAYSSNPAVRTLLLIVGLLLLPPCVISGKSFSRATTFVQPVRSAPLRWQIPLPKPPTSSTALESKKKKAAPAAAKKIQVKMIKHVAGTGQAGEVVMVTPAFFNNKLRPTSSAIVISDEEVAKEQAEAAAAEKEMNDHAEVLKQQLEALTLKLSKKAGPNGQLFGAIGHKMILSEVANRINDDFLTQQRGVKITSMKDGTDGKKMRGDIKHTGEFEAKIALTKTTSAKLAIVVEAES